MNNKIKGILFYLTIGLLSITFVLSVSIWKNRSLFFEEYIYNSRIRYDEFLSLIFLANNKGNAYTSSELSRYSGTYYDLDIDGKNYTNITEALNTIDSGELVKLPINTEIRNVYSYSDLSMWLSVSPDTQEAAFTVKGTIFIDMSEENSSYFQYQIRDGLKLQKLLYLECAIFVFSGILGAVLLYFLYKQGIAIHMRMLKKIPLDIHMVSIFIALSALFFSLGSFISYLHTFSFLRNRLIYFFMSIALVFISVLGILYFTGLFIKRERSYDEIKSLWDKRVSRKMHSAISSFILFLSVSIMMISFVELIWKDFSRVLIQPVFMAYLSVLMLLSLFASTVIDIRKKYIREIIRESNKIAEGVFDGDIAIIGNDELSMIAGTINKIKGRYIESLDIQRKNEALKYELITNISHDLRSPLTGIINHIDLAKTAEAESDVQKHLIGAEKNSKILHMLIEDLFSLSKIESGTLDLDKKDIDLILLIKQVASEFAEQNENRLEILVSTDKSSFIFPCDSLSISRLFDNLIGNAVKYSVENTRIYIDISISEESNSISVEIKNISRERLDFDLDELFLRFKRGDKARTTQGSGLGLAISKGIVNLHGGSISLSKDGDLFKVTVEFMT